MRKTIKSECVKTAQPDLLFTPTSNIYIYRYLCNVVLNESKADIGAPILSRRTKLRNLAKSVGNKI